jgi:hypothetical protein
MCGVIIWLLLTAVATYAAIYYMYMPTIYHNLPVHFDFRYFIHSSIPVIT